MSRLFILALVASVVLVGCASAPTPTPTSPPPTLVPATETSAPPPTATETLQPTVVPPSPTPTAVAITGTVNSNANVRQAPSREAQVLGQLNKGESLSLIGRSSDNQWLQINYPQGQATTGWILATLIDTQAAIESLPAVQVVAPAASPTRTAVATPKAEATKAATVAPTRAVTATETVTATAAATATVVAGATATPVGEPVGAPPGSILYDTFENGQFQIYRIRGDGSGKNQILSGASEPALRADNVTLAFHRRTGAGGTGLALISLNNLTGNPQLVTSISNAGYPSWSPDGSTLVYHLPPTGALRGEIWKVAPDGTNATRIAIGVRPAWQPFGNQVLIDGCDGDGANCSSLHTADALNINLDNPKLITHGTNGAWSPNGQQIAFHDYDESGHINVFVANADGSNRRQVTKGTGHDGLPIWSADGQWLYYRSDQNGTGWAIYAIRVDGTNARKIVDAPVNPDIWDYEKLAIAP